MEYILEQSAKAGITGALLYICWNVLPPLKEKLVKRIENSLERHGLLKHYKTLYRIVKTSLYILLAIMILVPVLFFLVAIFADHK